MSYVLSITEKVYYAGVVAKCTLAASNAIRRRATTVTAGAFATEGATTLKAGDDPNIIKPTPPTHSTAVPLTVGMSLAITKQMWR